MELAAPSRRRRLCGVRRGGLSGRIMDGFRDELGGVLRDRPAHDQAGPARLGLGGVHLLRAVAGSAGRLAHSASIVSVSAFTVRRPVAAMIAATTSSVGDVINKAS